MIQRIFLDLDDTCNTLAMHVLACVGCKVRSTDYTQHPGEFRCDLMGRQGILRPWNGLWGQDPFEAIERQLENLF